MADLLGKPDPTARVFEPFHCYGCGNTQSRNCPHGQRQCKRCRNFNGPECRECLEREWERHEAAEKESADD